jgi:deoxyribodipyrimidine photolyase-related protein
MSYHKLAVVLGNCLFADHASLNPDRQTLFFMAEDSGLCTHFRYHKHKLMLFLSAMRSHADTVRKDFALEYWSLSQEQMTLSYEDKLTETLKKHPTIRKVVMYVIEDKFFDQRIRTYCHNKGLGLEIVDSPAFLNTHDDFGDYLSRHKKPLMHHFYLEQRKKLGILLDDDKPRGGNWSYDDQNRKKLPRNIFVPELPQQDWTSHTREVAHLVDELFENHPGQTDGFRWATTRSQALHCLDVFLRERFQHFGPYEDAIDSKRNFLFHSVLSPYLNLGLLSPAEVLDQSLEYAEAFDVHLPSVEGFVRQIIGWREFMRGMYRHHTLKGNYFNHQRKLKDCWYKATTGVPPLDDSISRVKTDAYTHHIERLMVLGNIMLLSEIHPDEVYRWFMEMFIDSSDWVMEPNVYAMSQFAEGGIFATKPYIGGANYICKMSDYRKTGPWTDEIDGLYWRFVHHNRKLFSANPRMAMMVKMYDKMQQEKKDRLIRAAENFMQRTTEA